MGCFPASEIDTRIVMAFDPSQIQLPPRGARLRLPPTNTRKPTYAEVCQIARQHLSGQVVLTQTHVQGHPTVRYADSERLRTAN
jgi:hypothetical protein